MGLFNLFKRGDKRETESNSTQSFKSQLDEIEKTVFATLKPYGFKKRGRTFNRETEKGIFQVINLQAGQYPIGQNYEVPELRESLYGKFTVNLGVCVSSLNKFQYPNDNKTFYQEYDCEIRTRLGPLLKGQDHWWIINNDIGKTSKEIIDGILSVGYEWFAGVDNKEKIIENFGTPPYASTPRAKLDVALLVWLDDKGRGAELVRQYINSIPKSKNEHKKYVEELAKELGI